jgi:hypothetical protein
MAQRDIRLVQACVALIGATPAAAQPATLRIAKGQVAPFVVLQHRVNEVSVAIDCPIQVAPAALDLQVGFIGRPTSARPASGAVSPLAQRRDCRTIGGQAGSLGRACPGSGRIPDFPLHSRFDTTQHPQRNDDWRCALCSQKSVSNLKQRRRLSGPRRSDKDEIIKCRESRG